MEFYLISQNRMKVALRPEDLERLGITYDKLDYADPLTRRALVTLLEEGKRETGFNPRRSKIFIEAFPSEEGGCILFFCRLGEGQRLPSLEEQPGPEAVVFRFEGADALADAAEKVFARYGHRIYKSSLYWMDGGYRLVVYPLDYADHMSTTLLGEFASRSGEGEVLAAFIEEHGESIIRDTAVETLAKHFG